MRDSRTVMLEWTPRSALFLVLAALGCGSPAPEPEPEPTTGDETVAAEPEPPPPPPPARLRVVHASPDPAAATVAIGIDGAAPAFTALSLHAGTDYVDVTLGAHELLVQGASAAEGTEPGELARAATAELASEARYTAVLHGLTTGEPSLQVTSLEERGQPPAEGAAGARLFHALVGTDGLDVCIAGATPRDRATPLHAGLAYGAAGDAYVDLPAEGELELQLRAPHATPCRGRMLGVARTALTIGANHTFVLLGHPTARPRVERELVVCTEGEVASCIAVPVTSR